MATIDRRSYLMSFSFMMITSSFNPPSIHAKYPEYTGVNTIFRHLPVDLVHMHVVATRSWLDIKPIAFGLAYHPDFCPCIVSYYHITSHPICYHASHKNCLCQKNSVHVPLLWYILYSCSLLRSSKRTVKREPSIVVISSDDDKALYIHPDISFLMHLT